MSSTLVAVRNNVRWMMQDTDPSNYAVSTPEMNRLIQHQMQAAALEIGQGPAWVTGAITFTPGTSDYTLPTGVTYQQVQILRLGSQGWPLTRLTSDQMVAKRRGPVIPTGIVTEYTIWEDTSQNVNVRFFPTPNTADTVDIFRQIVPASLSSDASTIPFSETGLRVLELRTAIRAAKRMTTAQREQRLLSPDVISQWEADAEKETALERRRINQMKRTGRMALGLA